MRGSTSELGPMMKRTGRAGNGCACAMAAHGVAAASTALIVAARAAGRRRGVLRGTGLRVMG